MDVEPLCLLLPHLAAVEVQRVALVGGVIRIEARTRDDAAAQCPDCGTPSARAHSRYQRHPADTAIGGQPVAIDLSARRLFCDNSVCPRHSFAEQVDGLTLRYSRRTTGLLEVVRAVAIALAGRAGSRLMAVLGSVLSRTTMVNLLLALPTARPACAPRVLGVDDFALRKRYVYGTILIDMESGEVVDVLSDRTGDTLAAWLTAHPGTEIICRDRAGAYADGATRGAPGALQIADRWHLWKNLADAVDATTRRLRPRWTPPPPDADPAPEEPDAWPARPDPPIVLRHRERHAAVHALMTRGAGVTRIAAELRLDPKTVRKFMRADTIEDFLATARGERPQNLDRHAEYLVTRFNEGCTRADILHAELTAQGVHVSSRTVRRFVQRLRREPPTTTGTGVAPKATAVIKALLSHPDGRAEEDNLLVKEVCTRSLEMETVHSLIGGFATMMQNRWGITHLDAWLARCENSGLPELETLARGLRQDQEAVRAGLSLEWNSGKVEGNVNRLKMLKRQTYGRARLAVLAKHVTQP